MSNSHPPDPQPNRTPVSFEEGVAVVVALGAMGAIFFGILGKNNQLLSFNDNRSVAQKTAVSTPTRSPESFNNPVVVVPASPSPGVEDNAAVLAPEATPSATSPTEVAEARPQNLGWLAIFGLAPKETDPAEVTSAETTESSETPTQQAKVVPVPVETPEAKATSTPQQPSPKATSAPKAVQFSDVPQDYWAKDFIAYFATNKIVNGFSDGSFKPEQPMTREATAAHAVAAFNFAEQERKKDPNFKDVSKQSWAFPKIRESFKTGFFTGYPGRVFQPKDSITRAEVLVALVSGLDIKPPAKPKETLKTFKDANQVPEWALNKVAAAKEAGLIVNHPKKDALEPNTPATRAEVSAMIYQALAYVEAAKPIDSDYVVKGSKTN